MSVLKRNTYKIFLLFFIGMLIFSIIQSFARNQLIYEINEIAKVNLNLKKEVQGYTQNEKFEGKYIWEFNDLSEGKIKVYLENYKINKEYIFIIVDTIECFACFKFHMGYIKELNYKLDVIVFSPLHADFVKSFLPEAIILKPNKYSLNNKTFLEKNLVILFMSKNGKIIYADIADKINYKKSKIFYHKIKNFITM